MTVDINGEPLELEPGTTLLALLEARAGTTRGSAVVVDGAIVPRSDWPTYEVRAGQRLELITAVQGG
jgi:sulfur carrier protein